MDAQSTTENPLKALEQFGQSPWLDFIERKFLADGKLGPMIEQDGLKGMTSNPSIFEKAMGHGTNYDDGFKALAAKGDLDAQDLYEHLAIEDIQHAADLLRPVYERTRKVDGYVSLEVSPYLALYTDDTITEGAPPVEGGRPRQPDGQGARHRPGRAGDPHPHR